MTTWVQEFYSTSTTMMNIYTYRPAAAIPLFLLLADFFGLVYHRRGIIRLLAPRILTLAVLSTPSVKICLSSASLDFRTPSSKPAMSVCVLVTTINVGALVGEHPLVFLLLLFAAVSAFMQKFGERYRGYARDLQRGWSTSADRVTWAKETFGGLYLFVFNPFNAFGGLVIFLLRNVTGAVPYFAWFFFLNLVVYCFGGGYILTVTSPHSRFRMAFLYLFPLWLRILTILYDLHLIPFILLLPTFIGQLGGPSGVRICSVVGLVAILMTPGTDPSGAVDLETAASVATSPIVRTPIRFLSGIAGVCVTWGTMFWIQNMLLRADAKPGTVGSAFHKNTTHYSTPAGVKADMFMTEYVKTHGLHDSYDGRFRAWAAYYSSQKFTPSEVFGLAKQATARKIPLITAAGLAALACAVSDAADKA